MRYRWWVYIAASVFGAGLASGLVVSPQAAGPISQGLISLEELADLLAGLPRPAIFALIFLKNVSALLVSFALSPFLCLMPLLSLVANGWVIAIVSGEVVRQKSIGFLLAGLLPHGIFELPAFVLGQAAALSFGAVVMLALFKKETRALLPGNVRLSFRYLVVAIVLLLPAALIEAYITPLLLK
ncbi:MAG: stage II sporulation protein M [Chloroflexi bacterium]|nr:stage II sporulation protein M [Chloroflexota bacterium]